MTFTANRLALIAELRYVLSAYRVITTQNANKAIAPTHSRLPVSCRIADGVLSIQTYDGRTALASCVPVTCDTNEPTHFAMHVDVLADYLDMLDMDKIEIEVDGRHTHVHHADGVARIPHLLELPVQPGADEGALVARISLTAADIVAMVDATGFAAIKGFHAQVSGTMFAVGTGFTRLVATNGAVMSMAEILEETPEIDPFDIILTPDALARLRALIRNADEQEPVILDQRERVVVGQCSPRTFVSGHASGAFPRQYDKLLSPPLTHRLDAVCKDVQATVRFAMLAAGEDASITLTLSKDGLGIASAAATCELLPAFCANENPLEIVVNGRYFTNALAACPTTRVELRSSVASRRLVLEPVGGALAWKTAISSITPPKS
jgi:hypothetical protein